MVDDADQVSDLLDALSILRIALPATLLGFLFIRFSVRGALRLMGQIQSQGWEPPNGEENPWSSGEDSTVEGDQEEGDQIRPVVVRVAKVRRGLVLSLFGVVAVTYFTDGVAHVVATLITNHWTPEDPLFINFIPYSSGNLASFALCGILMIFEERSAKELAKWGKWYPRFIAGLALCFEFAILGVFAKLVALDPDARRPEKNPLPIINIGILGFRLLLLVLLNLSFTPILFTSTFSPSPTLGTPTTERTSLLGAPLSQAPDYGTTPNGNANGDASLHKGKKPNMLRASKPLSNRPPDPKSLSLMTLFLRVKILFPYLWPSKSFGLQFLALLCVALMFSQRVAKVVVPFVFGQIISDLAHGRPPYVSIGIWLVASFLVDSNEMLRAYLWLPVEQYSEREMTMMAFDTLLNLSLSYHTRRKTGELMRILDRGEAINNLFESLLFTLLPIVIDIPVAVIVLGTKYGLLIIAIVSVTSFVFVATSVVLAESRTQLRRKLRDASQYMRQIQTDTLFNWETVKIFTAENFESQKLRDAVFNYQRGYFRIYAAWNSLSLIQDSIQSFGLLVCSFILAKRVIDGDMDVGAFATFVSYINGLYGPLSRIAGLYRTTMNNLVDTEQLMDLLNEPKDIIDLAQPHELVFNKGSIEFKNVFFSYDDKQDTLKGISFKVESGQNVALVGPSGGGKSTIMRLLYRFYDVKNGSIDIEGRDIREYSQDSLRRNIGLVPQDSVLFNETARYNIAFGGVGREPTEEDVVSATRAAALHDRIMSFPDKYETRVGERGQRLSGGEKQRVAIARVLLKNPPILLLDEATSALDTTNERAIQASLRDLSIGRTTVSIAHRLSTVVDSDQIFVLNEGRIVENGNHFQLLQQGGLYAELWQKQIEGETGSATPARKPPHLVVPGETPTGGGTPVPGTPEIKAEAVDKKNE